MDLAPSLISTRLRARFGCTPPQQSSKRINFYTTLNVRGARSLNTLIGLWEGLDLVRCTSVVL